MKNTSTKNMKTVQESVKANVRCVFYQTTLLELGCTHNDTSMSTSLDTHVRVSTSLHVFQ